MSWLRHGVPIALLADLLEVDGPASTEIYRYEAIADDVRRDARHLERSRRAGGRAETG
jgi:hypothetical protein